jgi:hypothetical protein
MFEDILGPRPQPGDVRVFTRDEYLNLTEVMRPGGGVYVGYIFTDDRFKRKFRKDGIALYYEVIDIRGELMDVIIKTARIKV